MSEWVAIWRFAIVCILIAFAVVFLGGCAAPPREVRMPTYAECVDACRFECDLDDCADSGLRPVGTDEGGCRCGAWDA